jgi:O-antigen/teichoic acid export membrane protein
LSLTRKVLLNATVLGATRVAMAAISLVTIGISTRYLGIDAWGSLAVAMAFVAVIGTFTDLGLWTIGAREIAKRPDEARHIVSSLLTIGIVFSLAAAVVGIPLMFLVYPGDENELLRRAILLLMATLPLAAPYGAGGAYFVAQQKAYVGALGSLITSVVTVSLVALAAALDWGFNGIVLAYVIAAACQAAFIIALSARQVPPRLSFDFGLARQLFVWALPLGAAVMLHTIYWRLDLILLSLFKPDSEVAIYALAAKLVDMLVVLPTFVMITLLPEFARLTSARERFDEIVQKAFSVMQVAAVPLFVFVVVFASELVRLAGGAAFEGAARVLQILMVAVAFMYFGSVFREAFLAHNKQMQLLLVGGALGLPLNVVLNLALIPLWGAEGSALAWVICEAVMLATVATLYRRFATLPRVHHAPRVFAAGCAAAGAALVKLLPFAGDAHPLIVLSLGGALCVTTYALALYALKAMPREVHANIVLPLWARLRPQ